MTTEEVYFTTDSWTQVEKQKIHVYYDAIGSWGQLWVPVSGDEPWPRLAKVRECKTTLLETMCHSYGKFTENDLDVFKASSSSGVLSSPLEDEWFINVRECVVVVLNPNAGDQHDGDKQHGGEQQHDDGSKQQRKMGTQHDCGTQRDWDTQRDSDKQHDWGNQQWWESFDRYDSGYAKGHDDGNKGGPATGFDFGVDEGFSAGAASSSGFRS